MVNTKHDTGGYDRSCYQREIFDGNALYDAYIKAKKGSDWKPQVQKFEMTYLLSLAKVQQDLKDETYEFYPEHASLSTNVVRPDVLLANRYRIEW